MAALDRTIHIVLIPVTSYQPIWKQQFEAEAEKLSAALGEMIVGIDHIGSTAVEGLLAKPIIDVQISVTDLSVVSELVPLLQGIGYVHRPDADNDRPPPWESPDPALWEKSYFRSPTDRKPRVHIHVREVGRPNHRYALLFRDYLRANSRARDSYGRYKVLLSESVGDLSGPGGTGPYLALKQPVLDLIADAAESWSVDVQWRMRIGGGRDA